MFTIRREAFWIGQYTIYWYGIIMAASVLVAILIAYREEKRLDLPRDTIIDFSLVGVPLAVVFARLYYVAFEWETVSENLWRVFAVWEGGIAMYGALIGGAVAAFILKRWKKVTFGALADAIAPGLVLAQTIGRWGNFTNQEAYGPLVTSEAAQWFPLSVYIERVGQWHMATFFYESMWCLVVFIILWFFIRRRTYEKGQTFAFYLLLYGGGRSIIEGLRMDSLFLGMLRVSQFGSVLIMLCVCCLFLFQRYRRGFARRKDWLMLACAVLAGAIGIVSHNALLTEIAWLNWLGTFVCAFVIIFAGLAIWRIPLTDDDDGAADALKILRRVERDPAHIIEEAEINAEIARKKSDG